MWKDSLRFSFALILLGVGFSSVYAQVNSRSQPTGTDESSVQLQEVLPRIIYTLDENGRPSLPFFPVPFERLNDFLQRTRPGDDVRYVLGPLQLTAAAESDHVVIQNTLRLTLLKDGVSVVPIKMGDAELSLPKSASGNISLRMNEQFREWELIVDGEKDDQLTITFESLVALRRIGRETHLSLRLPRTPESKMTLRVPQSKVKAQLLTDGGTTKELTIEAGMPANTVESSDNETNLPIDDESTLFAIQGLPANLDIAWFPETVRSIVENHSFEVEGDIEVEVDTLGGVTGDALLTLTSFNKPIESLIVKLPENTRLADTDAADFGEYTVSVNETQVAKARREVRVTFAVPSLKPPSVRINVKAEKELSEFELAGFEVLVSDADQRIEPTNESGVVSVISQGTRRLQLKLGEFARRVVGNIGQIRARYSRPNQVQLLISRPSTDFVVEPSYLVQVDESGATLTAISSAAKARPTASSLI